MADVTSKMMAEMFQSGQTCIEIAKTCGLTQSAVRHRIRRLGCDTSRRPMHPLDSRSSWRLGIRHGTSMDVSRAVGDRIIAEAARHSCTMWEAVDRLLR